MSEIIEEWRWIIGYEGMYQISNLGRVKSFKLGKEKIMKVHILKHKHNFKEYYRINLCKDGKQKKFLVHQLVAQAFLGHVIDGYTMVVNHIDNNGLNNKLTNLEVVTQRENCSICALKNRNTMSSPLPGASWSKTNKKWMSEYTYKGKKHHLGYFDTDKEASDKWYEAYEADKNGEFEIFNSKFKRYKIVGINQYTKYGEFICEWNSLTEIENTLFICLSNIIKCCKGERNFAGGFIWKYKEKEGE